MSNSPLKSDQDMFSQIREGFAYVAANARHVKIREDNIAAYAQDVPSHQPDNTYDGDHHFLGRTAEETASYVLAAESVNFGSGYKPALVAEGWKTVNYSIYFTVTTALKNYYEQNGGTIGADKLAGLTLDECGAIFGFNDSGATNIAVRELFHRALTTLGAHVRDHYDSSFATFLQSGKGSAKTMLAKLAELPYYNDVHDYNGTLVPVFKRAQHTLAVIDLEFTRLGQPLFADRELMTMFADNAVPHVLRVDDILEYSPELAQKIANGEELTSGSVEEIEIRCCAGHAVELIAQAKGVSACDVDFNLWHRSVEDAKYRATPTHKTRSIYY